MKIVISKRAGNVTFENDGMSARIPFKMRENGMYAVHSTFTFYDGEAEHELSSLDWIHEAEKYVHQGVRDPKDFSKLITGLDFIRIYSAVCKNETEWNPDGIIYDGMFLLTHKVDMGYITTRSGRTLKITKSEVHPGMSIVSVTGVKIDLPNIMMERPMTLRQFYGKAAQVSERYTLRLREMIKFATQVAETGEGMERLKRTCNETKLVDQFYDMFSLHEEDIPPWFGNDGNLSFGFEMLDGVYIPVYRCNIYTARRTMVELAHQIIKRMLDDGAIPNRTVKSGDGYLWEISNDLVKMMLEQTGISHGDFMTGYHDTTIKNRLYVLAREGWFDQNGLTFVMVDYNGTRPQSVRCVSNIPSAQTLLDRMCEGPFDGDPGKIKTTLEPLQADFVEIINLEG